MKHYFEVGEYVVRADIPEPIMGVVTKVAGDIVTVFFKYPDCQTRDMLATSLTLVSETLYREYERQFEVQINHQSLIDSLASEDRSIEQAIDEILFGKDESAWWLDDEPVKFSQTTKKYHVDYFYTSPKFEIPPFHNSPEWEEALKQAYIDMALQTGDKEWFDELTKDDE